MLFVFEKRINLVNAIYGLPEKKDVRRKTQDKPAN